MKIGRQLVLLGVMGLVVLCLPGVALGEDAAAPAQPAPVVAQPAPAPVDKDGPMKGFSLAPRIGYAYLGGQAASFISGGNSASSSGFEQNINAMKIDLDLKFSGRGGAFELDPFYMLMAWDVPGNVDKMHAVGLDLGFLYSWYIPAGGTAIYPGIGFGIGFGPMFNDPFQSTFAMLVFEKLNASCTFYPSKSVPIGIVLEWGIGMNNQFYINSAHGQTTTLVIYGFYTDLTLGIRFF